MVKYKSSVYLLSLYFVLIIISAYFLFFYNSETSIVIIIMQISSAILSIIAFSFYIKELKILGICQNLKILLNDNSKWENIEKLTNEVLQLKKIAKKNLIKLIRYSITVCSILIVLSLALNLLINDITFYIIPALFIIFLNILVFSSKLSDNPVRVIIDWISESCKSIKNEFNQLSQFKINESDGYFEIINIQTNKLLNQLKELGELSEGSLMKTLDYIKDNINRISIMIREIYEIRGMLVTLMSVLLELRKKQVIKYAQVEQIKQKEIELARLKTIEEREEKFVALKKEIEYNTKKSIENDFNDLKKEWSDKINEFEQKISKTYDTNYQRFGTLNDELKGNYTKLQTKTTNLFFEKIYQEMMKPIHNGSSIDMFFEEFMFIADTFFMDTLDALNLNQKEPIMEKLCKIHESMK
ncbi:MAG: hypothetical protein ACTSO8_05755 [Promethearchaeota archaeon]